MFDLRASIFNDLILTILVCTPFLQIEKRKFSLIKKGIIIPKKDYDPVIYYLVSKVNYPLTLKMIEKVSGFCGPLLLCRKLKRYTEDNDHQFLVYIEIGVVCHKKKAAS